MDSSFLTMIDVGLGLYSGILFLKMIIQFGLPNHPARFTSYLVSFCATVYFCTKAAVSLNLISPWLWMKWEPLPLVAGGLALLIQTIMMVGEFSLIQQKVVSRLPLIAGLLCFAFFPAQAPIFFGVMVFAGCIFLSVSVGKARYQKRMFFKMAGFLALVAFLKLPHEYAAYVAGEFLLFFAIFYFFLFEQTFGIAALMDKGVHG